VLFAVYAELNSGAQQPAPVLISHADSTRAIAFDSVTRQREPFSTSAQLKFGSDNATRIMLFAMNLDLQTGETISADAEDASHTIHTLTVESAGKVPEQPWATSIVVRLPESLPQSGDVLVRINYRGVASNRVRVGIGQIGGGPADDVNAVPGLSKLPIIGRLFRSKSERAEQTELLVLITPQLVRPLNPDEVPPLPTLQQRFLKREDDIGAKLEGGGGVVDAPDATQKK